MGTGLAAPPQETHSALGPWGLDTRPFSGKTAAASLKNIGPVRLCRPITMKNVI